MKKTTIILLSILSLAAFCGCRKEPDKLPSDENVDVFIPSGEYIYFNTDVATRGTLIDGGSLQDDFNVIGYKFTGSWNGNKVMAKPNVFTSTPLTVTYNYQGYHDYVNPVEWTGDTYAFFAYYPAGNSAITTVNSATEDTPYIDYTLDVDDPSEHVDVMTACLTYANQALYKHGVDLTMRHRLSAFDLVGYSNVSAKDVNSLYRDDSNNIMEGWTDLSEDAQVYVKISTLSVTVNGISYDKVRIYLDKDEDRDAETSGIQSLFPSKSSGHSTSQTYNYTNRDRIGYKDEVCLTDVDGKSSPMILIPQSSKLTGTISVTYSIVDGVGTKLWPTNESQVTKVDEDAEYKNGECYIPSVEFDDASLDEGIYTYLQLDFTKTGLFVRANQSSQWTEIPVEHQFE